MLRKFRIKINSQVYEVEMEELDSQSASTVIQGNVAEMPKASVEAKAPVAAPVAPATAAEAAHAPMPGTITEVRAKVGQVVKKNEVVLILEAMKMANEIVAEKEGTVREIYVQKGQQVNAGDPMLLIS